MTQLRRTIRRISPEEIGHATEPWWPVFLALLVFAGFACGTVLAYLRLDAPEWYANAATWLVAIGAIVVGALVATLVVPPRTVRRSVQLAIVLNLLFHLVVLIASVEMKIFGDPYKGARPAMLRSPRRQPSVIPDYPSLRNNELRRQLREQDRPVEVETPIEAREITPETPNAPQPEITEEPTPNIPLPSTADAAAETTSLPETPTTRRADSLAESGPAEAQSARFSESSSLLSRREVERTERRVAREVEPLPDPSPAPTTAAESPLSARETNIARSDADALPSAAVTAPQSAIPKIEAAARAGSDAAPSVEVADTPATSRRAETSRRIETAAADAAPAAAREVADPLTPQATALTPVQAESTPSPSRRDVEAPSEGVAASSSLAPRPRAAASEAPSSETLADSGNRRRATDVAAPNAAIAAPESPSVANVAEATELAPASIGRIAQQSGQETAGQLASQSLSKAPDGGTELRAAPSSRANRETTAAPAASNSGDASLPRAAIAANTPRSPINAEAPDLPGAGVAASGEPTTPTQTSITQAESGIAGGVSGPNLDRAAPSGPSPALVPSGSARREVAMQAASPGDAFESNSAAVVRRSQAGAAAPSTSLRAEDTPFASSEGSQRVADLRATSSAALSESSARASDAPASVSPGVLDVDLGPTQIVAQQGDARGSGGGAPQIQDRSFDAQPRPAFSSARSSGYVPSSLKADVAAGSTAPQPSASPEGIGPAAESLKATQHGGGDSQSLASLTGREAPASPGVPGPLASAAPGTRAASGAEPTPSLSDDEASGAPTGRRAAMTPPTLAGVKAEDLGEGVAASEGKGQVGLQAEKVAAGGPTASGNGAPPTPRPVGEPGQVMAAIGGAATKRADGGGPAPAAPETASDSQLALRGELNAAPSIGLKADEIELARNTPSEGFPEPGLGLAQAPGAAQGADALRQGNDSLPALLPAPDGVGGLGAEVGPDAGINRAVAMRDSAVVDDSAVRLSRSTGALAPTTIASTAVPKEAFEARGDRLTGRPKTPAAGSAGAPSPETEEAIERGLAFLASVQQRDGRWSLGLPGERTQINSDTAATALALLAFQGAGYTHREHKHQERVAAALQFLLRNQKRNGDLYLPEDEISNQSASLYSHALATIALCEAYGMTQDPALKEPAERAIDFILQCQNPERGGWRYVPQVSSDTSVSGWMLMALKSGQLAGISSAQRGIPGVKRWLDLASAKDSAGAYYVYNPYATDAQAHGRAASHTMTSVGLLMRFYTGWNRDHPAMVAGASYLRKNPPKIEERDTYYWYYGTQVMFHMGGEYWEDWNRKLHSLLIESQIKQGQLGGSWDPYYPVRDRWAAHAGRIYVTTMNLLSLEVYYRHLPLYEETAK